jgi:hypothetical protein
MAVRTQSTCIPIVDIQWFGNAVCIMCILYMAGGQHIAYFDMAGDHKDLTWPGRCCMRPWAPR